MRQYIYQTIFASNSYVSCIASETETEYLRNQNDIDGTIVLMTSYMHATCNNTYTSSILLQNVICTILGVAVYCRTYASFNRYIIVSYHPGWASITAIAYTVPSRKSAHSAKSAHPPLLAQFSI